MGFFGALKAFSAIAGAFKQFFAWLNARTLKKAGRDEQRLENLEARGEARVEADQEFTKVDGGQEDLRGDL